MLGVLVHHIIYGQQLQKPKALHGEKVLQEGAQTTNQVWQAAHTNERDMAGAHPQLHSVASLGYVRP